MSFLYVERYHDFSFGHRVVGEPPCHQPHGHNARVTFTVSSTTGSRNKLGQVVGFKILKTGLCQWLEDNWDHRFLVKNDDPIIQRLQGEEFGLIALPFQPSAENLAEYLLKEVGPKILSEGLILTHVHFQETRKCAVIAAL